MPEKFVWVRPGLAIPDWSLVTAEVARRALRAMSEPEGVLGRLSNITPIEDRVWQAVLECYAEAGRAPLVAEIANKTGLDRENVQRTLHRLEARDVVLLDQSGEAITGAYPFTEDATPHRVHLPGHTVNAMCAIDALGAGAMYGVDVTIESACRQCERPITITTRDHGHALERVDPDGTAVWTGQRYANGCAATSLCKVLAFFCGDEHLIAWWHGNAPRPSDGIHLTLVEAMQVGKAIFVPRLAPANHENRR